MKQPIATFCSLALFLWGYQTGLWIYAIPMVIAIEGREFIRRRWQVSWETLQILHVIAGILWLFSVLLFPPSSPVPLAYAARYQILRGMPIALFPLILAQTYCVNVGAIYHNRFRRYPSTTSPFSLYYPYFGICLLAASATGGNSFVFLAAALFLVTGVLWSTRSPRFGSSIFYGLIVLAMIISLAGAHQFYWLEANVRLPNLPRVTAWIENIAASWGRGDIPLRGPLIGDLNDERQEFDLEPADSSQAQQSDDGNTAQADDTGDSSTRETNTSNQNSASSGNGTSSDRGNVESSDNGQLIASAESDINSGVEDGVGVNETDGSTSLADGAESSDSSSEDSAPHSNQTASDSAASSEQGQQGDRPSTANSLSASSSLPGAIQQSGGLANPQTSQTQIGLLGSLQQSNAILFRVKPLQSNRQALPYPLRIREATYNQYRSGAWDSAKLKFTDQNPSGPQRWTFGSDKGPFAIQIAEILKPKSGLLKLPVGTSEIKRLDVDALSLNQYGAVSFQRDAQTPLNYEVRFDPNRFGDSRPTRLDKRVPVQEQTAIKTVLKTLNLRGKSEAEIVQTVSAFFRQDFQYSLELPDTQKDKTPLASFLLDHRRGHCEYFASATSLLLRSAGIPTRYVVGYSVSEYNPTTQDYIVRVRDAHAWVMAYVNGRWITVDTTPSSGASQDRNGQETVEEQIAQRTPAINPENSGGNRSEQSGPSSNQGDRQSPIEDPRPVQSESASKQNDSSSELWYESLQNVISETWSDWMDQLNQKLSDAWSWIQTQFEKFSDALWFGAFSVLGIAIAFGAAWGIWRLYRRPNARRRWRRRKRAKSVAVVAPQEMAFTFRHIEERLQALNLQRNSSETPRQWVKRLEDELSASQFRGLKQILDLHYRHRFDPAGLDEGDREQLAHLIEAWLVDFGHRRVEATR